MKNKDKFDDDNFSLVKFLTRTLLGVKETPHNTIDEYDKDIDRNDRERNSDTTQRDYFRRS